LTLYDTKTQNSPQGELRAAARGPD
jgi:hypothetical protein